MSHSQLISVFAASLLLTGVATVAQFAGPPPAFELVWNTIDGGGPATGGAFTLDCTIGQSDASTVAMTGGTFSLTGGFWPGAAGPVPNTCPADIAPPPNGNGAVSVDDLLAVINSWGACPAPCPQTGGCVADIAPIQSGGNCFVNVDDLLAVINGWGLCP